MATFADDPRIQGQNIVYSFHYYEDCTQRYQTPLNDLASLSEYLIASQIAEVATRKPLLATELGWTDIETDFKITWFRNAMDLLIQHGIGFFEWVWSAPYMANHGDAIIATAANFPLTTKGNILTTKTLSMPPDPTTPPNGSNILVPAVLIAGGLGLVVLAMRKAKR
jgi:hypothetical protein